MNLLVSVRSAEEAIAALAGGAGLIDVKEPNNGALGFAGEEVIEAVLRAVDGWRPVSAALGELASGGRKLPDDGSGGLRPPLASLTFAKWGLAGCRDWPDELARAATLLPIDCRPVAVAYADWQRAQAPPPADVCGFVCSRPWGAFLIDTWGKDGSTLLDWLALEALREMIAHCRAAGIPIALAGSLGIEQLRELRPLQPDWFAVRGAACRAGQRTQPIDEGRVRRLVDLLSDPLMAATPGS